MNQTQPTLGNLVDDLQASIVLLLEALKPGLLKYKKQGQTVVVAVGAGYAEADASHVKLIAEFFARIEDVDVDEARKDLEKAEHKLKTFTGQFGDTEHGELQKELDWARARLDLVAN